MKEIINEWRVFLLKEQEEQYDPRLELIVALGILKAQYDGNQNNQTYRQQLIPAMGEIYNAYRRNNVNPQFTSTLATKSLNIAKREDKEYKDKFAQYAEDDMNEIVKLIQGQKQVSATQNPQPQQPQQPQQQATTVQGKLTMQQDGNYLLTLPDGKRVVIPEAEVTPTEEEMKQTLSKCPPIRYDLCRNQVYSNKRVAAMKKYAPMAK